MQWFILILASCVAIGFCMLVFALKARREGPATGLHRCSQGDDCRCYDKSENGQDCKG